MNNEKPRVTENIIGCVCRFTIHMDCWTKWKIYECPICHKKVEDFDEDVEEEFDEDVEEEFHEGVEEEFHEGVEEQRLRMIIVRQYEELIPKTLYKLSLLVFFYFIFYIYIQILYLLD